MLFVDVVGVSTEEVVLFVDVLEVFSSLELLEPAQDKKN